MKMLANVALPAFLPHSFATLIGIFVIAAIEAWFLMRTLDLRFSESYKHALNANWKSTIAGIPLAWLFWIAGLIPVTMGLSAIGIESHPVVQSTLMQTAIFGGMMPTEWMNVGSAAAWLVMLIPFWLGSVWIERRAIMKRLPERDAEQISSAVVRGNLASYSVFLIFGLIALWVAIGDLPNQRTHFEELRERREASTCLSGSRERTHHQGHSPVDPLRIGPNLGKQVWIEISFDCDHAGRHVSSPSIVDFRSDRLMRRLLRVLILAKCCQTQLL